MLIVTFTNAAASEMREKILDAIYEKIEEEPNNAHLRKQITLLNKASICTIHSFCLDVIRNYFYELDLSNSFQIGDSSEMELLKQETLDDLFEEQYINKDNKFLKLIDTYATYRGDDELKNIILRIDDKIQSEPFPEEWLNEKVEMFNLKGKLDEDFSNTIWGGLILKELKEEIIENRLKLEKLANTLKREPELIKFTLTLENDANQLKNIENIINGKENIWDKTYTAIQNLKFEKWPIDKKVTNDLKNEAKEQRDKIRKAVNNINSKVMIYISKEANLSIYEMYDILDSLKEITINFENKFAEKKKEKNRIDFHDIEHFALKILIAKDEHGNVRPSKVAQELQEKFDEIAIDEYQDSNMVQELILTSVSKKNNIFMVGDIKQSIYSFREARPDLFLEKYRNYGSIDSNTEKGIKIKLFKNFRSRKEVLDLTNWIFENIMSEKLGDVEYTKGEYLNLGANYEEQKNMKPELHILDQKEDEPDIWKNEDEEDEQKKEQGNEEDNQILEKNELEAKLVANRIKKLFNEDFEITDRKKGKRKIEYRDIVILLRSTANVAQIYEKELTSKGFPVFCDTSSEYLETIEIQTILALLKIIDNPMQDLPLIQVLRSPIGNFTDNELIEIRLADRNCYFYEAMLKARISAKESLRKKIDIFLNLVENLRELEKELPLNELIWKIYSDTNYYNYVGLLTNGELKQANLKMLFEKAKQYESASFKGLYNFINFIDRLHIKNGDMSSAKIVGENDNVIRIMSIHKSKGLEFPVVFLCNFSKKFNKQDLNDSVIIHHELGFGVKNIDSLSRIEYSTLSKEAIKIRLEQELISEEMRILYVALTRAKEKLIITGTSKDWNKFCKTRQDMLSLYSENEKDKLQERLVKKYQSYLDWICLLMLKEPKQDKITLKIHKKEELKEEKQEQIKTETKPKNEVNQEAIDKIANTLEWKYPYQISSQIPTKTSVSKIKEEVQENEEVAVEFEELINKKESYKISNFKTPEFAESKDKRISSARKGSLIHLCLQKLDSRKDYTEKDVKGLIQNLADRNIISQDEADAIQTNIIMNYFKSNLWGNLKQAKEIHKEEAFYLYLPANEINKEYTKEDKILVQGVIDLYYIDKENNLNLIDYKTDYVEKGQEEILVQRYKKQLELYKEALEKALNRKVNKTAIYSTYVGEIEI